MCNMCFLPSTGISARIFAKWLELPTLNEINDLIETGFVQTTKRRTISLHPMIQEITLSETKPSVTRCHILLDSLQKLSLMHGIEVDYKDDDKDNHSLTEKWKSLIPMLTALCMWREEPRDKTYS